MVVNAKPKPPSGNKKEANPNPPQTNPACPIQGLPAPKSEKEVGSKPVNKDERYNAFKDKVAATIKAPMSDPRARVVEVANIVSACTIHLGSCGSTARNIFKLAGLKGTTGNNEFKVHVFEKSDLVKEAMKVLCYKGCGAAKEAQAPAGCKHDVNDATNKMREMVKAQQDQNADKIKPGDWLWIFNGNSSCSGQHSFIFIKWDEKDPNKAHIVDGSWGKYVKTRTVCLRTKCSGGKFAPITRIMRAVEVRSQDKNGGGGTSQGAAAKPKKFLL